MRVPVEDSQAVTARRRRAEGEEKEEEEEEEERQESLLITQETLKKLQVVVVLQDEGIVYCPIPKVHECYRRALHLLIVLQCGSSNPTPTQL